ncbi:BON domain-containing protein [Burkholderia sp. JP2-270]|uniref:BON domain-containing protein n=1 Tax=Burkholderia sp. JP2-270 TaxID=2217913 RepID=UPI0013A69327|nr:BON domain-containing protein [Burkholderia sp. JP2-270]
MKTEGELRRGVEQALEWDLSVEAALVRHVADETRQVEVGVHDGCLTLTGRGGSLQKRQLTYDAAWLAQRVCEVVNQLTVV